MNYGHCYETVNANKLSFVPYDVFIIPSSVSMHKGVGP